MSQIDHIDTYALLIGSSSFPEDKTIIPIPNVLVNLNLLKESLLNSDLVGIPESNIIVSHNENKIQIERKLFSIAENTRNKKYTLFVYYTGHGIMSTHDYELYLATHGTSKAFLESDAISIESFKKHIKHSLAGRKIIVLDCCHSGAIIGSMGDMSSSIQARLKGFEGTYVMTSAAYDEPSLFPFEDPSKPTFFTGKFLEIINSGLDIESEYCSLREIFNKIRYDFNLEELPLPQQSNFNNADELYFSKNTRYLIKKNDDEKAWKKLLEKNSKWDYLDFINQYPETIFFSKAKKKIYDIEEQEKWDVATKRNTVFSFTDYLHSYPNGKFVYQAKTKIELLRSEETTKNNTSPEVKLDFVNIVKNQKYIDSQKHPEPSSASKTEEILGKISNDEEKGISFDEKISDSIFIKILNLVGRLFFFTLVAGIIGSTLESWFGKLPGLLSGAIILTGLIPFFRLCWRYFKNS